MFKAMFNNLRVMFRDVLSTIEDKKILYGKRTKILESPLAVIPVETILYLSLSDKVVKAILLLDNIEVILMDAETEKEAKAFMKKCLSEMRGF